MSGWNDERMKSAGRIVITMLGLASVMTCHSQNAVQFIAWGDSAMADEDYYGASKFYAEALLQDGGRMAIQWKYAEACRLSNQYPQAAEAYDKVQRKDMGRTYHEAWRWLGEMQLCAGRYDDGQKTWQKVKQKEKDKSSIVSRRAENALNGIRMAKAMMATPETVVIENLPEPLNTYDSEFGARQGPDSALYVSSLRGEVNDNEEVKKPSDYVTGIYRNAGSGKGFAPGMRYMPAETVPHANATWSGDGLRFYFTECPGDRPCTIMMRSVAGIVPVAGLGSDVKSTQPMLAVIDGREVLFFASDRPGGEGGMDIWRADLALGIVSNVRPLGPAINTPGNETCPFYDVDQRKLYFSSDFLPGLGGYDNFMSKDSAGTFTAPVNFGYPLNSPANDLYPTFEWKSMSGYFTSNRIGSLAKKGATCCNDIYRYSYPLLDSARNDRVEKDTATLAEKRITSLREKLPIRLYFHNDEPNPRSQDTLTGLTYEQTYRSYKALLPDYHNAWGGNTEGLAAIDDFFQEKVDHGFAQLNEFIALLEQAMEEGQRIELQVRGFASPLAKSDYNANLSLRRISSMVNYLREVDDGVLRPYLISGALSIRKSPFGEDKSATGVSDQLEDLKGSVYSVGASLERRIEIEQVLLAEADVPPVHDIGRGDITHDIGTLHQAGEQEAIVRVRNSTGKPLTLTGGRPDCDCMTFRIPEQTLKPGEIAEITAVFNGRAPLGPLSRGVTITTDGEPATLRLIITGTVTPHE
jgi:tetratricopeptide (TPR) repeat protein